MAAAIMFGPAFGQAPPVLLDLPPDDCFAHCPPSWGRPVVSIQTDGVFISGRRVTDSSLGPVLTEEFKKVMGRRVYVRADADVPYGEVLRIYRVIERAGFEGKIRTISEELE